MATFLCIGQDPSLTLVENALCQPSPLRKIATALRGNENQNQDESREVYVYRERKKLLALRVE
jgi:hypothetical protein